MPLGYSDRMKRFRCCLGLLAGAAVLSACAIPARQSGAAAQDADLARAELALARGECRAAAETYTAAADRSVDVSLARRALEVAVRCEHWPARARAAARWRILAPEDPDALRAAAAAALGQHRITAATETLRALFALPGEGVDDRFSELASTMVDDADAYPAFTALRMAAPLERFSAGSLVGLGRLGFEAYDFGRARELANQALGRDPGFAAAYALLARVYATGSDDVPALEAAHAALRLDASGQRFVLADTLTTLGRVEEAGSELERLQADESASEEARRRLALLAFEWGDLDVAQRRFLERLERGEGGGEALYYLALIAERRKDYGQSLRAYALLAGAGLGELARPQAARLLLKQGDRAAAMSMLDEYVVGHPESAVTFTIAKAQMLAEIGEAAEGAAIVDAALGQYPDHPRLSYEHAVLLERAGSTREAIRALGRLADAHPENTTALNALGYTLADHGRELPRAEALIRRALAATPDHPAVLDSLGWVRFRRGDTPQARRMLERAYLISGDPEIAAHWGEVLWSVGERTEARRVWAQALARHPDADALSKVLERLAPADPQ